MWFNDLTGFQEGTPDQVRDNLEWRSPRLYSRVNERYFHVGALEVPTLKELRQRTAKSTNQGHSMLSECVADVQHLHTNPENEGALFQVASQFNLLEMVGPEITPDMGVDRYEFDLTQGPACAIACGAGTIYRNYFVPVNNQVGQTAENQIDCLAELSKKLDNERLGLWHMRNGYALATAEGLRHIAHVLDELDDTAYEAMKGLVKVGIQEDTEVTLHAAGHRVSQVYCSAVPIAYSSIPTSAWESFARLMLSAAYEAALHAAVLNRLKLGNPRVYLTLLGGGAFGNPTAWIMDALRAAIRQFANHGLDIRIVSYGQSNAAIQQLIKDVA